jgi:hypothetical protein
VGGRAEDADPAGAVFDDRTDVQRMYSRAPVTVWVSKKSAAKIACAWPRQNAAQFWLARPGAGWMPPALQISHTVDGATLTPRAAISPWTRR